MPPYAICSSGECCFLHDFKEDCETNEVIPFPENCPTCKKGVIFHCPLCSFPLLSPPSKKEIPRCENCGARLRNNQLSAGQASSM